MDALLSVGSTGFAPPVDVDGNGFVDEREASGAHVVDDDTIRVSQRDIELLVRASVLPARLAPKVWDALILRSQVNPPPPSCEPGSAAVGLGDGGHGGQAWATHTMFHTVNLMAMGVLGFAVAAYTGVVAYWWQRGAFVAGLSVCLATGLLLAARLFLGQPRSRLVGAA